MDLVAGIDDDSCMRLMRLFNEVPGRRFLIDQDVPEASAERLDLLGISGIANLIGAIKTAKYFEWTEHDVVFTVSTDSMEMYRSRLQEQGQALGAYSERQAGRDYDACLMAVTTDHMLELSYWDKKRMHNLKYFTWVEQLGKDVAELDRQWNDETYWSEKLRSHREWDRQITEFNARTGLLDRYV
jgi:hypothetical protein